MRKTLIILLAVLSLALMDLSRAAAQEGQATQSYVVQRGDTAERIARRFYGKSNLGARLWQANRHLVAHPNQLTAGDTIYLFPESTLALRRPVEMPPEPEEPPIRLYDEGQRLEQSFPKNITLLTNIDGRVPVRVHIKRNDPLTGAPIDQYFEVREVGEVISSIERGGSYIDNGIYQTKVGRTMLTKGDQVYLRFTEDVAKILDSDTYNEDDPYFRTFPVYAVGEVIREQTTRRQRPLGELLLYRGNVTVDARIEGGYLPDAAFSDSVKRNLSAEHGLIDPVTYHAFITYSEDAIRVADRVLMFVPIDPGPERRLDPPYVEGADTFVSPGK
jgi:hypothetical protein